MNGLDRLPGSLSLLFWRLAVSVSDHRMQGTAKIGSGLLFLAISRCYPYDDGELRVCHCDQLYLDDQPFCSLTHLNVQARPWLGFELYSIAPNPPVQVGTVIYAEFRYLWASQAVTSTQLQLSNCRITSVLNSATSSSNAKYEWCSPRRSTAKSMPS